MEFNAVNQEIEILVRMLVKHIIHFRLDCGIRLPFFIRILVFNELLNAFHCAQS